MMGSPRSARAERGFTLTELMVVVALIGVMTAIAMVYLRPKVKTIDVANRVGDLVREGNRQAVALGPVRANVALAQASKARTRIIGSGTTQPTFILQRLEENATPTASSASWIEVSRYTVDRAVIGESWGPGVGSHAALTPLSTDWTTFETRCFPDGTCQARTLFFQAKKMGKATDNYARTSIMPLGGAILTRQDWN